MDSKTEEFYKRLKLELENGSTFPLPYLFKFIVPSSNQNISRIESAFDLMGAVIQTHTSRTGKFTSVSVSVTMPSSQSIIDKYIEVSDIEGIVSL
jgi:hypothetical protein